MTRNFALLATTVLALAACTPPVKTTLGPDGTPLPKVYRINGEEAGAVEYRFLDAANALRQARGLSPLQLNAALNAAAATHARDMGVQNRAWHFGSDGSSPIDRVRRAGYGGRMLGENISESYETELQTLSAWMSEQTTAAVLLDPNARDLGIAWFQEPGGKLWWTMLTGS